MGSQARATQYQVTHFVRGTVAYNSNGVAAGIVIGHIPSGARYSSIDTYIDTAQNAGTTNTVSVGFIPESNGTLTAAPAAQNQFVSGGGAGTVGLTKTPPPAGTASATTDQAIVVSLAQSGAAATAGVVTVVVTYFPNL